MSERALPEFAPFAATLAQRLTKLVTAGQLAPDQPLWELAVDRFLVLAVDTEGQVPCSDLQAWSAWWRWMMTSCDWICLTST